MVIEIPDDIADAMRIPPKRMKQELLKELAVQLVREGILSRPRASRLAGMERVDFYDLLADRRIPWTEDVDEVFGQVEELEPPGVTQPHADPVRR